MRVSLGETVRLRNGIVGVVLARHETRYGTVVDIEWRGLNGGMLQMGVDERMVVRSSGCPCCGK